MSTIVFLVISLLVLWFLVQLIIPSSFQTGISYLSQGMTEEALQSFIRELEKNPDNFQAHLEMGNIYYDLKYFERAIQSYQTYLKLIPDVLDKSELSVHKKMARYFNEIGHFSQMLKHSLIIHYLDPKDTEALLNISACYGGTGRPQEMMGTLNEVLRLNPESIAGNFLLGLVHKEQKNIETAIEYFEKCIHLKPDFYEAYIVMAACYADETTISNLEKSVGFLQEVENLAMDFLVKFKIKLLIANCYTRMGKYDEGEMILEELSKYNNSLNKNHLISLYFSFIINYILVGKSGKIQKWWDNLLKEDYTAVELFAKYSSGHESAINELIAKWKQEYFLFPYETIMMRYDKYSQVEIEMAQREFEIWKKKKNRLISSETDKKLAKIGVTSLLKIKTLDKFNRLGLSELKLIAPQLLDILGFMIQEEFFSSEGYDCIMYQKEDGGKTPVYGVVRNWNGNLNNTPFLNLADLMEAKKCPSGVFVCSSIIGDNIKSFSKSLKIQIFDGNDILQIISRS